MKKSNVKNKRTGSGVSSRSAYEYGSTARQLNNVQAVAKANSDKIIELKSTLNSLKDDNDALESDINASIDYNALYNTAVNELGMVYPGKDQVITYNSKESEYVKQYKDVPDAN